MLESLISLDEILYFWINNSLSNGLFDLLLVPLRHKMFWIPLYLFLISYIILNYKSKSWVVFVGIICTIGLSDFISSSVIKKSIKRVRPCHQTQLEPIARVPCTNGFSFTSSHATNHFAIGTFFFLFLSGFKYRWVFLLWAGIISFAQVYVGVHYPLDVVAGGLVGICIGLISFKIYKSLAAHFYKEKIQFV